MRALCPCSKTARAALLCRHSPAPTPRAQPSSDQPLLSQTWLVRDPPIAGGDTGLATLPTVLAQAAGGQCWPLNPSVWTGLVGRVANPYVMLLLLKAAIKEAKVSPAG